MIELKRDELVFSFPEVHPEARFSLHFQRTLRIPDDDRTYPLPAGLGRFPVRHVDDFAARIPELWRSHGGVMLPMYQAEAMWLSFRADYPFALKVAAGKIDAVTGEAWSDGLNRGPQDYLVLPDQPWLDGFAVEKGIIRQFVAMPLGTGYSAEEQLTGKAEHGGLQLVAYPVKAEVWEEMKRERARVDALRVREGGPALYSMAFESAAPDMGLAPGGRMRQHIYEDEHDFADWDLRHRSRCFVHLADALTWARITGEAPPTEPPSADDYRRAGIPWFDYYDADRKALEGADTLKGLESVAERGQRTGDHPLPDNESLDPGHTVPLRPRRERSVVREM